MTVILQRRRDWRTRLYAVLDDIKASPLDYGAHDCGVGLAARAIEAMTGTDLAARWRGRYDTATGALRVLREDGFADLETLCRSMLPSVHPSMAQLGDIALVPTGSALDALGIVIGERIIVLTDGGTGTVDLLDAKIVFRV